MKQIIGGATAVIGVAWLLFVFSSSEPCDRIHRGAAPVRISMDTARWAAKNWLSSGARLDMIRWSIEADQATQRFLQHQFYGEESSCVAKPAPTPAVPPVQAEQASEASQLPMPQIKPESADARKGQRNGS